MQCIEKRQEDCLVTYLNKMHTLTFFIRAERVEMKQKDGRAVNVV